MFVHFNSKFLNSISYETYHRQIKQLNIAFIKLGEVKCMSNINFAKTHEETKYEIPVK